MWIQRYIEHEKGNVPLILSCPHGGFKKPVIIPDKLKGDKLPDDNTFWITKQIVRLLHEHDIRPYYVISKIHRSKIDFNRPPLSISSYFKGSSEAKEIYDFYHDILTHYSNECTEKYKKCLVIDIHGYTRPRSDYPDFILGNIFGNSLKYLLTSSNKADSEKPKYWVFSELVLELSRKFTLDDGLGLDDYNVAYSGGYILYHYFQRENINAFQLELSRRIRLNVNLLRKFFGILIPIIVNNI